MVQVAVVGCGHGALEGIYAEVRKQASKRCNEIDLLLICGDFQACRNESDLACMACPDKYKSMNSFYKYYSGELVAPVLTIFIGGNHEASNYMQELFYGGWVAPNIYYLGCAGVVKVGGLRIGGISGIYNKKRYVSNSDRYEHPPYTPNALRSVYHLRPLQVQQALLLTGDVDIFMSHDWPRGIVRYGDKRSLLRKKKFLRDEIENNTLGSEPAEAIMQKIRPNYWFSGHMHVRFPATVTFEEGKKQTSFLALDKCLPFRDFLEVLEIGDAVTGPLTLNYDEEWLAILSATQPFVAQKPVSLPPVSTLKPVVANHLPRVKAAFDALPHKYQILPTMFLRTVPEFKPTTTPLSKGRPVYQMPNQSGNPQTDVLLGILGLQHVYPVTIPSESFIAAATCSSSTKPARDDGADENEIDLDL